MNFTQALSSLLNELVNLPFMVARTTAYAAFLDFVWKICSGEIQTLTAATNLAPIARECLLFGVKAALIYLVVAKLLSALPRQSPVFSASLPNQVLVFGEHNG